MVIVHPVSQLSFHFCLFDHGLFYHCKLLVTRNQRPSAFPSKLVNQELKTPSLIKNLTEFGLLTWKLLKINTYCYIFQCCDKDTFHYIWYPRIIIMVYVYCLLNVKLKWYQRIAVIYFSSMQNNECSELKHKI